MCIQASYGQAGFSFSCRAHGACSFVTIILDMPCLVHEFIRGYLLQAWLIDGKQGKGA